MDAHAHGDLSNAVEPAAGSDALLDLSPQQRNLLLMRPIFQLEFSKNSFSDGALEGLDTYYLSLSALMYMMEGAAVTAGYTQEQVLEYLQDLVTRMRPTSAPALARKAAEIVIDTLDNAAAAYQEHRYEYYHAPSGESRSAGFRLTTYEPDAENIYRYRPTSAGYLILLGMLDLQVEDHQILVEKMLQVMIERGRFDQAYEFARQARQLSIQHRQQLRDFIEQAKRAPGSVSWARDVSPPLTTARQHIAERQEVDRTMEESVHGQMLQSQVAATRSALERLLMLLRSAATVRAQLQGEVARAADDYMTSQAGAFRARKASGYPDLESRLLPAILCVPTSRTEASADALIATLYPAVPQPHADLSQVFSVLLERHESDALPPGDDAAELTPFQVFPDPFPRAMADKVHEWVTAVLRENPALKLSAMLQRAHAEGFNAIERQCLVYAIYRSFPESESLFTDYFASPEGTFAEEVAQGDDLLMRRKEPIHD